ncbi:hypothetical protein F4604DRAFT_1674832 [Suillus subluteus]|nr:hypothetical protein F4604DRAFT_1674832 [Suillus subluteus]
MSHSDIRCCHNRPVQMLPHPCFTLEQFIEAIRLVQSGQNPHQGAIDSNSHANVVEDDTDVSDIWISPADNVDEDILPGSELDFPSSDGEESERGCQMVDVNSSVETLVNIDINPASCFKWFVSTGHHGMGLFNDIYTARKLRAAGTTVYYFRTLSEAEEHFQTAFNAWCTEALLPWSHPTSFARKSDILNIESSSDYPTCTKNKTTEQAKSRTRWQKHSQMSESIVAKFQDLDILYMELGYRAGVPEHNTFMKHFLTILQHIDTEGWDVISPELEDAYTYVHNLHRRITNLAESVQLCAPVIGHDALSQQSGKHLPNESRSHLSYTYLHVKEPGKTGVWHMWRNLRQFQNNFFAHNDAAGRAVRNETNDTPQETRQEQQCKHISFEATPTDRLAVSSLYYTVPHSPAKHQFGEPESQDAHNLPTDDFDFSSLNDVDEDIGSGKRKHTAGDNPLHLWNSDADLFLLEFIRLEGHGDLAQTCWNGISFQTTMLKALGVRFQLGHPIGVQCVNPIPTFNDDLVILDYNGVHEVGLNFCGCESAQPHITQLLRVHLFPTTTLDPKSAATFLSAWEFYNTVARLTDNTGTHVLKDRYASLLRMIHEWRFVMQMKRCAQGHHPGGIQATEAGACAVLCPACPHPSRNLLVGWENSPPEFQFLYAMFLAIDANFQLVQHNVSSDAIDPGLNRRYAFFVEETAYKDFLASHYRVGNPQEKSTCSSHSAVNLADTRASRGLAATGAGTVDFGDLQKGESCQTKFSFNFIKGVGRTDGEAPEHRWADINPIATSTREMGPGSRRDTLDDHFNDWNWKKVCSMGTTLLRKYKAAIPEVEEHASDLKEFEAALDPNQLATWQKEIEIQSEDYNLTAVTQATVHLALSKAEAEEIEHGEHISLDDDISPSALISSGMELEDQQRHVEFEAHTIGQHATDAQKIKILQHINALRRRISTWSQVQLLYMPTSPACVRPMILPLRTRYEWDLHQAQANDALDDLRAVINMTYHLYKYKNAFVRGHYSLCRKSNQCNIS